VAAQPGSIQVPAPSLFDPEASQLTPIAPPAPPIDSVHAQLEEAEAVLLDLADYVYAHTSLKPMSKALFLISRALLAIDATESISSASSLCASYEAAKARLGSSMPADDFSFSAVVDEARPYLKQVLASLYRVRLLTRGADGLGLAFNTLLRGKWESGEGLGTYLTPEEVVRPMVEMVLSSISQRLVARVGTSSPNSLFGDICGGTGRFVYWLAKSMRDRGAAREQIEAGARLFDQSSLAVGFARINFALERIHPHFVCVGDSLVSDEVSSLKGRFIAVATNPPFGNGKYRWSPRLKDSFPAALLRVMKLDGPKDTADPSLLFVFRNLDLLAGGGVLGIVLPDGVLHSEMFKHTAERYESERGCGIELLAVVSLPVATFSLGGTVAKTSFAIVRKGDREKTTPLFVGVARHVGFLKRGNRRVPDPAGDDLTSLSREFVSNSPASGKRVADWRQHSRLAAQELQHMADGVSSAQRTKRLDELVEIRRDAAGAGESGPAGSFHVSVLDVDETGLIDIIAASRNTPKSRGLACAAGDILVSCLNPRIWRVAVVPSLEGVWSCSPEFAVLRPRKGVDRWRVALGMHHPIVSERVVALASGTSSSRQRVRKDRLQLLQVPWLETEAAVTRRHGRARERFYALRLREGRAYSALRAGESRFRV